MSTKAGGIQIVSFDFPGLLERLTHKKGWKEIPGPDSRCGLDYWYRAGKSEANINVDQGEITVAIDGETVFSGMADLLKE